MFPDDYFPRDYFFEDYFAMTDEEVEESMDVSGAVYVNFPGLIQPRVIRQPRRVISESEEEILLLFAAYLNINQ